MEKEKKEFLKEIVNREEIEEEKKKKKKKSKIMLVIDIILWVLLFIWIGICIFDFIRVKNKKEPIFCINEETLVHENGEVDYCLGLGYKVYNYNLDNYTGVEFGPFWISEKEH